MPSFSVAVSQGKYIELAFGNHETWTDNTNASNSLGGFSETCDSGQNFDERYYIQKKFRFVRKF